MPTATWKAMFEQVAIMGGLVAIVTMISTYFADLTLNALLASSTWILSAFLGGYLSFGRNRHLLMLPWGIGAALVSWIMLMAFGITSIGWVFLSLGYFRLRRLPSHLMVGLAFGFVYGALMSLTSVLTRALFSGINWRMVVSIEFGLMAALFWLLMYLLDHHPKSPLPSES